MKRYAKNPAELVIHNPTNKTMAKRKRGKNGKFKKKRKNAASAADEFVDTGKNLFMQYGLAALASTFTVRGVANLLDRVPNLPTWAKRWGVIAVPAAGGTILSMATAKNNAILQGLAGGMVLASANTLSDRLIGGGEMAGLGNVDSGDLIIKKDGYIYDQQGNKIAALKNGDTPQVTSGSDNGGSIAAGDESVFDNPENVLGDFDDFSNEFDDQGAWAA